MYLLVRYTNVNTSAMALTIYALKCNALSRLLDKSLCQMHKCNLIEYQFNIYDRTDKTEIKKISQNKAWQGNKYEIISNIEKHVCEIVRKSLISRFRDSV